jgi:hypothetical protein
MFVPNEPVAKPNRFKRVPTKSEPIITEPIVTAPVVAEPIKAVPPVDRVPTPPPANLFLLDRDNIPFLERRATQLKLNPFNIPPISLWVFAAVTVMIGYFSLSGLVTLMRWGVTTYMGEDAHAIITDARTSTSRNRGRTSTSYYLEYTYTINGQTYVDGQFINGTVHYRAKEAKEVTIRYWSLMPSVARLSGDYEDTSAVTTNTFLFIFFGLITVGMIYVLRLLIKAAKMIKESNRRLLHEGRVVYGEIMGIYAENMPKSGYRVTINYAYRTPDDRSLTSTTVRTLNWLKGYPLPAKGTPIAICYVDDKLTAML